MKIKEQMLCNVKEGFEMGELEKYLENNVDFMYKGLFNIFTKENQVVLEGCYNLDTEIENLMKEVWNKI